jgi:hypothetical protein
VQGACKNCLDVIVLPHFYPPDALR